MNFQSTQEELQLIDRSEALAILKANYSNLETINDDSKLAYQAFASMFSSTSGPFKTGGGRAMSIFTVEVWSFNHYAVFFCRGKVFEITDNLEMTLVKYPKSE